MKSKKTISVQHMHLSLSTVSSQISSTLTAYENSTFRRAAHSDIEVLGLLRTKTNPGIYNNGQFQSLLKGSQVDITTDNINIDGVNRPID